MTSRHYSLRSVTIVVAELTWILLSLALLIASDFALRRARLPLEILAQQVGLATLLYLAGFYYCDLYNFAALQVRRDLITAGVRTFSALAVVFGVIFLWTPWLRFHSTTILVHMMLTTVFVVLLRTRVDGMLTRYGVVTRIAIVGTGQEARRLAEEIGRRREYAHEVTCFVGEDTTEISVRSANPGIRAVPVIPPSVLPDFALRERIRRILVATADLGDALPVDDLLRCKAEGYEVEDGHTFYERLLGRIFTADLTPRWLIFSAGFTRSASTRAAKRIVDLAVASAVLIMTAPLCLLVALAVKLEDGGPVLFRQVRVGRSGIPFQLWKFRSMRVDAEAETGPKWAENDDPRVTRVGRWLRVLRIDEVPQAWNVVRGDMSFVGPRPERPEFQDALRAVIPYYDYRHAVRPGITGWAQVNLPYGATVDDAQKKLEYDLYYLKNFSVLMDVFVLFRTVKIIMFGWGSR